MNKVQFEDFLLAGTLPLIFLINIVSSNSKKIHLKYCLKGGSFIVRCIQILKQRGFELLVYLSDGCSTPLQPPEIKCHIVPNFNISKDIRRFTVLNCIITKNIVLFQEIGWAFLGIIHSTVKYCEISDIIQFSLCDT